MPNGVPVATVALNGAKNAAILAIQILGCSNEKIRNDILNFKKEQENKVLNSLKKWFNQNNVHNWLIYLKTSF